MGRDSILKETTLAEYIQDPKAGNPDMGYYVSSGEPVLEDSSRMMKRMIMVTVMTIMDMMTTVLTESMAKAMKKDMVSLSGAGVATKKVNLWGDFTVETAGHRWGMTIDLNTCIDASCVTACHSENNVPVVGKEEVRDQEI